MRYMNLGTGYRYSQWRMGLVLNYPCFRCIVMKVLPFEPHFYAHVQTM